jgi:hypothetical protein
MTTHVPASRTCWLFCCASLIAVAISRPAAGADPAAAAPKITVQMWVVEVSTDKLRNLGFDWSQITTRQEFKTPTIDSPAALADSFKVIGAGEFLGFIKALEQNNLARVLAEPTIATVSGRKASLAIGEQLKLDVTPTAIDDKHLQLQYRVEVGGDSAASSAPLLAGSTVQIEPGKPYLISQTRSSWRAAGGKPRQTETLLLVLAEFVTSGDSSAKELSGLGKASR